MTFYEVISELPYLSNFQIMLIISSGVIAGLFAFPAIAWWSFEIKRLRRKWRDKK